MSTQELILKNKLAVERIDRVLAETEPDVLRDFLNLFRARDDSRGSKTIPGERKTVSINISSPGSLSRFLSISPAFRRMS
jgi:hypothetical protein